MKKPLTILFLLVSNTFAIQATALAADGHYVFCHYPNGTQTATMTSNSLDTLSAMSICVEDGGVPNTIEHTNS